MPLLEEQKAGILAHVRIDGNWRRLTSRKYGDWTYLGCGVGTDPTKVEVLKRTRRKTVIRWTFGNHVICAQNSPSLQEIPYPFTKTIWVRHGERGYYAEVTPLRRVDGFLEHEIGFGGLWGAATVRTPEGSVRTDDQVDHYRTKAPVGWATLRRDSEDFKRHMIMLDPEFARSPYWGHRTYGSVHRHGVESESFAVYLYGGRRRLQTVCRHVASTRPRSLPRPSC